ncbi:BrnA antitoxin family protein [Brevundimonas sp. LM2]|uniref:BrnA antitoxin family protein n=1 Tax=Brevundimonas sp. LM2 TaxID=1938605 RepID=UPI00209ABBE9|nr:BrnA antitoxin family protein [Brevundimonas sp. LM2]
MSDDYSKAGGVAEAPLDFVLDEDDAPELTNDMIARARLGHEVLPEYILAQSPRSPGRPRKPSPKVQTTLRLDAEVIDFYKAGGPGWQSRINAALRKHAGFTD